jgi:hypothetical protein
MAVAKKYKNTHFLVLCGHTHTAVSITLCNNLEIKVGGAEYYKPRRLSLFSLYIGDKVHLRHQNGTI